MSAIDQISSFVRFSQKRFNIHNFVQGLSYGYIVFAATSMLIAAASILKGFKVDLRWLIPTLLIGMTVTIFIYLRKRISYHTAIEKADRFYDLKDGLVSSIAFHGKGKENGIYKLQAADTSNKTTQMNISEIKIKPAWPLVRISSFCMIGFILLSFLPDSPGITAKKIMQKETLERTEEIKNFLKKEIDELEEQLDEQEKELLAKTKLRQMVEQLKDTKDRKEALRQYALLEKRIRDFSTRNNTAHDEKFLSEIARELRKGKENPSLAKNLAEKKYKDAAEDFEKLKQTANKDLENMRKNFTPLKKTARRMKKARDNSRNCKSGFCDKAGNACESVSDMASALSEAEKELSENKEGKECYGKLCDSVKDANECLAGMSKDLRDLEAKRRFLSKLGAMRKKLGMCQSSLLGQCQMPGGLKAGFGTDPSFDGKPEKLEEGYLTSLKGQKGKGPTQYALEDSSKGDGVSLLSSESKRAEFKYQVESFVRREDIPETLKNGVKTYFEIIHEETEKE
ncbi:hypothetical protein ACFLS1_05215 [Verrucomicrobiota bacterium]